MIHTLTPDGVLHWTCMAGEADERCLLPLSAHVSQAQYRLLPGEDGPHGAMIDLPACTSCGARCSLKADYSLKELFKATDTLTDATGGIIGYALQRAHVHNLLVHHYLHAHGQAAHPPVLGMPTREELADPTLSQLNAITVLGLWFGFAVVRERDPRLSHFGLVTRELAALLPAERTRYGIAAHLQ